MKFKQTSLNKFWTKFRISFRKDAFEKRIGEPEEILVLLHWIGGTKKNPRRYF